MRLGRGRGGACGQRAEGRRSPAGICQAGPPCPAGPACHLEAGPGLGSRPSGSHPAPRGQRPFSPLSRACTSSGDLRSHWLQGPPSSTCALGPCLYPGHQGLTPPLQPRLPGAAWRPQWWAEALGPGGSPVGLAGAMWAVGSSLLQLLPGRQS